MGSVELLECMGNDLMVVNAARVSFAKESHEFSAQDEKLISYLAKHNHNSPFFHPQTQFRLKMPIFVAREWYRHTVGFSRNEVSRRYVSDAPECWVPDISEFRERDPKAKQGSRENEVQSASDARMVFDDTVRQATTAYETLLKMNVAPEIARCLLPQSMYTEFVETASLAAYARLYNLRTSPDAQREIRWYATEIGKELEKKFPVSWKALTSSSE